MKLKTFLNLNLVMLGLSVQIRTTSSDSAAPKTGSETGSGTGTTLEPSVMFATETPMPETPAANTGPVTLR